MKAKLNAGTWILIGGIMGMIDLAQFLIAFFGIPLSAIGVGAVLVGANEIADPFIGIALLAVCEFLGVSVITNVKRLLSLLGVGVLDEITGGVASFWFLDVWYIYRDAKKEQAAQTEAETAGSDRREPDKKAPLITGDRREPPLRA